MIRTRFGNLIVLACMGALAACTSGGGTDTAAGNTNINLTIAHDPDSAQAFDVDRVDYVIDCDGNDTGPADTPDGQDITDATTFSGQFEIVDNRTPPVWQAVRDLPPGNCTITLAVSDEDEVVCTGTETLPIVADLTTKFDIELVCQLSFQSPVGGADVDGTFRFVVGNFCPSLYVFNAIPSVHLIDGDGISELQVRALDFDGTCGTACDPDPPGTDPGGLSTTVTCSGGIQSPLGGDGSDTDNYVLDCNGQVGDINCSVDVTDGDLDCDKQETLTVTCPGANPCDGNPCDDGNDCTANACTAVDSTTFTCTDTNLPADTVCVAVGGGLCDGAGTCVPQGCLSDADCDLDGNECTAPPLGACQSDGSCLAEEATPGASCSGGFGVCDDTGACIDNCTGVDCSDGNDCTQDLCDPATNPGTCSNPNEPDGTSCNGGTGQCQGGTCAVPNNVCVQFAPVPVPSLTNCDGSPGNECICEKPEFLAADCELLGNSAPIPLAASAQQFGVAFAGVPVPIVPQQAVVLPAALICGFIGAGFADATVANSFGSATYTNADLASSQLNSFLDDSTAGGAFVQPHNPVLFDFGTACGDNCTGTPLTCDDGVTPCTLTGFTTDCSVANGGGVGTGPGIVAPLLANGPGTLPPGTSPVVLTPGDLPSVDIGTPYTGIALNLPDVGGVASGFVGGDTVNGVGSALCAGLARGAETSPRVMYDAVCSKPEFGAGTCSPFEDFTTTADVCKLAGLEPADLPDNVPPCCDNTLPCVPPCNFLPTDLFCVTQPNVDSCCAAISTDYPTAGTAQNPQLWVNP